MAHKKSYSRYFIILQEDEKGCALAQDKQPSGYTKIEIKNSKCKVSYYIQNLKRDKDPYHMVLVCNKKDANKLVNIGVLNIDDNGRADISYEFNIENIGGTGIATDKIGGAAIIRNVDKRLIVPMSGFASTDIPNGWKNYALIEASQKREEKEEIEDASSKNNKEETKEVVNQDNESTEADMSTEKEATLEVSKLEEEPKEEMREEPKVEEERKDEAEKAENNIFDEYEKIIDGAKDNVAIKDEKILKEDIRQEADEIRDEGEDHHKEEVEEPKKDLEDLEAKVEETREVDPENIEEVKEEFDDKGRESIESYLERSSNIKGRKPLNFEDNSGHLETEYSNQFEHMKEDYGSREDYPIGSVGEFFESIAEGFEATRGIFPELKKCKWYKVPVRHLDDMFNMSNYNKYTVIYYPMINYYPYIKKHGHYMLGYKCDKQGKMKYIVYGIPGTKEKVDQPYGGKSGFVTWVPDEKDEKSKYGYWLMFYDFRNSMVVVPMK